MSWLPCVSPSYAVTWSTAVQPGSWHPNKIGDMQKLGDVKLCITSKIFGIHYLNYWDRLKNLQLVSLQRRRERYIVLQMWKQLYGKSAGEIVVRFCPEPRLAIQAIVLDVNRSCESRTGLLWGVLKDYYTSREIEQNVNRKLHGMRFK